MYTYVYIYAYMCVYVYIYTSDASNFAMAASLTIAPPAARLSTYSYGLKVKELPFQS